MAKPVCDCSRSVASATKALRDLGDGAAALALGVLVVAPSTLEAGLAVPELHALDQAPALSPDQAAEDGREVGLDARALERFQHLVDRPQVVVGG